MKRLGIACFALLAGCGEELKPFTVVDRLRIAAVANTPVQPAPGQIFEATMLTLRAPGDDTPLTVLGSGCVSQAGGLACGPNDPELASLRSPSARWSSTVTNRREHARTAGSSSGPRVRSGSGSSTL